MPNGGCKVSINMRSLFESLVSMLFRNVPDECKTQDICAKVVLEDLETLQFVPDEQNIEETCEKAVERDYMH